MPPVPSLCLTTPNHQGATTRKDDQNFDSTKLEKSGTKRDDTVATRRSGSVKQATKCSITEKSSSAETLKDQFLLIGLPPPVVRADPIKKVQAVDRNMQIQCSQVNAYGTGIRSSPPSISQEEPSTSLEVKAGKVIPLSL